MFFTIGINCHGFTEILLKISEVSQQNQRNNWRVFCDTIQTFYFILFLNLFLNILLSDSS